MNELEGKPNFAVREGTPIRGGVRGGTTVLSSDWRMLATIDEDGAVRIVDAATGEVKRVLAASLMRKAKLALSPDGRLLAAGVGPGSLQVGVWRVAGEGDAAAAGW